MTPYQYLNKSKKYGPECAFVYGTVSQAHTIFLLDMVKHLAVHIKLLANHYHGLTNVNCKELANEFALYNNLAIKNVMVLLNRH